MRPSGSSQTWVTQFARRGAMSFLVPHFRAGAMPFAHGSGSPLFGLLFQLSDYIASAYLAAYYAPGGYGLPFPGWGLLAGRYSRSSPLYSASFATWSGIAVLPCFSASGKVPVTRCGLPLRGTYAVYWSSFRLDCHTLPETTLRKVVAPIPSGQTGLDPSRQAQFSAAIVISM